MKITCRINVFFFVCVVTLASLLSACGGGGEDTPSTTTTTPPATAIKTTIDEKSRVTAVIPPTGGTITTTGQDGTKYTLTFPAGSTATEIQVSLAPVISITGMGLDQGFIAAADMTPDGHQFELPVTLTIEPPAPITVTGTLIGVHIENAGNSYKFIPAQVNGNIYSVELEHFSEAEIVDAIVEQIITYAIDRFYGPNGILDTMTRVSACNDGTLVNSAQQVVDYMRFYDWAGDYLVPTEQCEGFFGGPYRVCSNTHELSDAARNELAYLLKELVGKANSSCLAGDKTQEAVAAECIKRATIWSEIGLLEDSLFYEKLCNEKTCGIYSIEIQPPSLELNVNESEQLTAIARDMAGNILSDREVFWDEVDTSVARLSNTDINNPNVTGVGSGKTNVMVLDKLLGPYCQLGYGYMGANIKVFNQFVTDAESVWVPEGATAFFQVKLASPTQEDIRVTVSRISGDSDITIASGDVLNFNSTNWDTFQTVNLFAYEDDDDIVNGTAIIQITDTNVFQYDDVVPSKEIIAKELDNDAPSMFITPDPLCVEVGQKANLSVIGNDYVDLGAITWSSSDIGVATVNATGVVDAASPGPARIIASMIIDNQVVASAFATITVKNHCAIIHSPDAPAYSCVTTASSPGFESATSSLQLEAMINTPQDGYALTWDTTNSVVLSITPNGDLTGTVRGVSGGSANVELTVNNIVTQYHATLPITVAKLPEDYKAAWLNLPYDPAKPHVLNNKREVLSYNQLYATLQDAVAKCNIDTDSLPEFMQVTNLNETGQFIGEYLNNDGLYSGFVFDTRSCSLNYFTPPMQTPPGSFENLTTTYPLAINDQGTIVGFVNWHAYDDNWCVDNPDYTCTYSVDTAFVLENGAFTFPFLNTSIPPYQNDYDNVHSRISDINNNRYTLFDSHSSYGGGEGLYQLDSPIDSTNPILFNLGGSTALNDYQHVIGTDVTPWFFVNGSYFDLNPVFSSGGAPSTIFADQINNSDDILARGANAGETYKHFLMYVCPLPIESPTAQWIEDRSVLEGYEELEVSCDGRDNDLNGIVDFPLVAQYTTKQAGVCAGMVKECKGTQGWVDDYSSNPYYEFPEVSCDGRDNDCDGIPDEGCPPSVAAIQ